jgi:uncharacterized membrane protein
MNVKRFLKEEWLQLLILITPFVIMAFAGERLPDRIPIRWNFRGHAKGYGPPYLLPLLNVGIAALLLWLAKIDPKAFKMNLPNTALKPLRLVLTAFFLAIFCLSILPAFGLNIDSGPLIPNVAFPLLFLLIGNFLPAVKPNYFIGVRTPWTLESPDNWRLTHKFTGRLWVIASIVYIVIIFLLPEELREYMFMVYLGVIIVPPFVYSYMIFQKSKRSASASMREQA